MIRGRHLTCFIIFIIASVFGGCGPLQPYTAEDFRGVTYQRYEEPPHRVFNTLETIIEKQEPNNWRIDSTSRDGNTFELFTNYAPTDIGGVESLRLKAAVREDKGTLASLMIQNEDTLNVHVDKINEQLSKPILAKLAESNLTVTNVSEQLEGTDDEWQAEDTFFDRIGFFANADGGISTRHNVYSSGDTLETGKGVKYETEMLRSADVNARIGLAGIQFAEYNYETIPKTTFQKQAYAFNEDKNVGIEKYTYGVDLLPLWLTILPPDAPRFFNFISRLLSVRFRSVKELTQTSAEVTAPSITYPTLDNVEAGETYSFRTRYRYRSATIPLYLFMANQGHINVGMAHWRFSRTYAFVRLPGATEQFILDGSVEAVGPVLEIYYEVHKNTLGKALGRSGRTMPEVMEGLRVDLFFATSLLGENGFNIEGGDLAQLADEEDIKPVNYNFELSLSYPIKMLQASNMFDMSLRIGGEANAFITTFENYYDYSKTDWILNPWARLSLEFN